MTDESEAERNAHICATPVELDGNDAWKLAAWASSPEDRRAKRDALEVAKRVQGVRDARYAAADSALTGRCTIKGCPVCKALSERMPGEALASTVNGLHLPQPWELGHSYEQGDPGWYICSVPTGVIVLVIDDEIPITRSDAERVLAALARAFSSPDQRSRDEKAQPEPDLSDPDVGRAFNAIGSLKLGLFFGRKARLAQFIVDEARGQAALHASDES